MKLFRMVRENRWTAFMLCFVLVLYSQTLLSRHDSPRKPAFSREELKQKETVVQEKLMRHPALVNTLSLGLLAVLIAGVALDIRLIQKKARREPWISGHLETTPLRWGLKDIFQAIVFLLFLEGVFFILHAVGHWVTGMEWQEDAFLMGMSLLRDAVIFLFIAHLVRSRGGQYSDLGLKKEKTAHFIRLGVTAYVAMVPVLLLTLMTLMAVMRIFSYEPEPQNVVEMYLKPGSAPYLVFFSLFVAGLGPLFEEVFFRGFLYPALRSRWGVTAAAGLAAAIFAFFHMNLWAFAPIFLLGLFLSYLYEATGSLVPSISAHILHNTLMVLLTLGFRFLSS